MSAVWPKAFGLIRFYCNENGEIADSEVHKYMPGLEQTLKHGKMSNIQDSIDLIEVLISGKVDDLGGRYFVADGTGFKKASENVAETAATEQGFLRVI